MPGEHQPSSHKVLSLLHFLNRETEAKLVVGQDLQLAPSWDLDSVVSPGCLLDHAATVSLSLGRFLLCFAHTPPPLATVSFQFAPHGREWGGPRARGDQAGAGQEGPAWLAGRGQDLGGDRAAGEKAQEQRGWRAAQEAAQAQGRAARGLFREGLPRHAGEGARGLGRCAWGRDLTATVTQ